MLIRTLRASLIDALDADYVDAARARGFSQVRVVGKHAHAQLAHPSHHRAVDQRRLPAQRHGRRRERLPDPRARLAARPVGAHPRLPGHPGARARLRGDGDRHQPPRRPGLRARSTHGSRSRSRREPRRPSRFTRSRPPCTGAQRRSGAGRTSPSTSASAILVAAALAAIFAPLIAPYDPNAVDLESRLLPPSVEHAMGTDTFGRDIASRVHLRHPARPAGDLPDHLRAARDRDSGRCVRRLLRRLARLARHAARRRRHRPPVPRARDRHRRDRRRRAHRRLHRRPRGRMGPLCAAHAGRDARPARAATSCSRPAASATRPRGSSFRHAMPNLLRSNIVFSTADLVLNLLLLASLSYLGLGVQPPTAELGAMVAEGQNVLLDRRGGSRRLPGLVIVVLGVQLQHDRRRARGPSRPAVPAHRYERDEASAARHSRRLDGRLPHAVGRRGESCATCQPRASVRGEIVGLVGESGSGKSVTCRAVSASCPSPAPCWAGRHPARRARPGRNCATARAATHPRPGGRHGLPGPDELAQPGLHRRPPDRPRCY